MAVSSSAATLREGLPTVHIANRLAGKTPFYYGWVILFAAGTSQFVRNAVASLTLAVFIYPISQDLGWSRTLIAGAASAGGLASTATSPVVGWLLDRYGARVVLTSSILVLGFSTMSLGWATAPIAFYLAYGTGRVIFSSPIQIGADFSLRFFLRESRHLDRRGPSPPSHIRREERGHPCAPDQDDA